MQERGLLRGLEVMVPGTLYPRLAHKMVQNVPAFTGWPWLVGDTLTIMREPGLKAGEGRRILIIHLFFKPKLLL